MQSKSSAKILASVLNLFVIFIFVAPLLSQAQDRRVSTPTQGGGTQMNIEIKNPFSCGGKSDESCSIVDLLKTLIKDILMPIGAVVAVLMVMYAGFKYVTARGNPGEIKKAHDALLWAVIGAAVLLGAWVISEAISGTINQLRA